MCLYLYCSVFLCIGPGVIILHVDYYFGGIQEKPIYSLTEM